MKMHEESTPLLALADSSCTIYAYMELFLSQGRDTMRLKLMTLA